MDAALKDVIVFIQISTAELKEHEFAEEVLPSSQDIARETGYKLDKVKKKLKELTKSGLINTVSFSPKRYRFNQFEYDSLADDNEWRELIES